MRGRCLARLVFAMGTAVTGVAGCSDAAEHQGILAADTGALDGAERLADAVAAAGVDAADSLAPTDARLDVVPDAKILDAPLPIDVTPACVAYALATCAGLLVQPLPGKTKFPIVLVHGMGGFEKLGVLEYWFGVPSMLRKAGYAVFVTVQDPFNSSDVRAQQLATWVDRVRACTCADKVNLVAHSQGGRDARELVTTLGYASQVASVTTIATPHGGTKVADALLGWLPGPDAGLLDVLAQFAGQLYTKPLQDAKLKGALEACSEKLAPAWNVAHPDAPGVQYWSWAGLSGLTAKGKPACDGGDVPAPANGDIVEPGLQASWLFLGGGTVPNDGLVPVESAKWGHFRGCVRADHMDEVGQIAGVVDGFDHLKFYRDDIAGFLASEGL